MSWPEAEEWCSSIGMTMPTMKEMCPSWDGNIGIGVCHELNGKGGDVSVWSATARDSDNAFYVHLSTGTVSYEFMLQLPDLYYYAFCH